jgi:hypothetical protein
MRTAIYHPLQQGQRDQFGYTRRLRRLIKRQKFCMVCSTPFQRSGRTILGFDAKGGELCTCETCRDRVNEFVTESAFDPVRFPKAYREPAPSDTLWRYMDLAKFISLLQESALYFCRADHFFDDRFEGATGFKAMKVFWEQQERAFIINAMKSTCEGTGKTVNQEKILQAAEQYVSAQREIREIRERQRTFLTCWHRNQEESDAMWQIYSRRNQYMLAIKTSVERLDKALGDHSDNEIGEVNYIDYRTFSPALGQQFWYKRRSFQHEQEIRVIIETCDPLDAAGLLERVKLDVLIEKIVLGPDTPDWFEALVKSITLKYDQNLEIIHSDMNAEPFF